MNEKQGDMFPRPVYYYLVAILKTMNTVVILSRHETIAEVTRAQQSRGGLNRSRRVWEALDIRASHAAQWCCGDIIATSDTRNLNREETEAMHVCI